MSFASYFDPLSSEQTRLKSNLLKAAPISRSESFMHHYKDWKNSQLFKFALANLMQSYESQFYDESLNQVSIFETEMGSGLVFKNVTNLQSVHQSFLLEYFREFFVKNYQMQRYNSQKWKRLIPDEGMEICERYILRQSTSWWRNLLPLKLAKSNIVILEIYQMEAQFVNLGIRIYIGNGESVQKLAVHKIMQAFFANN